MRFHRIVAGLVLAGVMIPGLSPAFDKPTGAPLVMSDIETEQPIPLAYVSPDGKAACSNIRLHWSTSQDDTASFTLDIAPDSPGAATFTAQLWNASLAGSLAWQKPWQGAHWKIFETPVTDGTGIDAALTVGMISTSARRPYPKDTLVIGNLHPDSSLGAVSQLADRIDAAATAGITRVIIPRTEESETDAAGHTIDIMARAETLGLKCIPVDNIMQAVEVAMNDPLPDPPAGPDAPKYSADVAAYIDDFTQREQTEAQSGLQYAPREDQLSQYPQSQAAVWKQVYAEVRDGNAASKSGKVYLAWRLLARANSRMRGMNALAGDALAAFDVKTALDTSDDLQRQLHDLMTPPPIDHAELQSGMLIAEMADWAYDIQALLEGSELVTKQTFSQRSDATAAERDRARDAILSANEEAKYLLGGAELYTGLLPHLGEPNPLPANINAANLLPQLIPAQLATAQIFTDGIRPEANQLRVGLLFDPRLAAYVNVLREEQAAWSVREHARQTRAEEAPAPANPGGNGAGPPAVGTNSPPADATNSVPLVSTPINATDNAQVGFNPGDSYLPPHTVVENSTQPHESMSDVAQCLIWVNTDCEIATLDEKYLRLAGSVDPESHAWHAKDRSQLDTLLELAASGAREGAAFAQEAQVSPDIFAMILERATYLRSHGDDANALSGLREYWRCALLGNMCWQLAHTHKAAAVELSTPTPGAKSDKDKKTADNGAGPGKPAPAPGNKIAPPSTNTVANPTVPATNTVTNPAPTATNSAPMNVAPPANPVEPATNDRHPAPISTNVPPVNPAPVVVVVVPPSGPVVEPAAAGTNAAPPTHVEHVDVTPTNEPPVAPIAGDDSAGPRASPVALPADTNAPPAAPQEHLFPRALPVNASTNAAPATDVSAATGEPATPSPQPPVAQPARDDEYTGGDTNAAPVAQPVNPPGGATTNSAPAIQ
jgi:hypothetical protein